MADEVFYRPGSKFQYQGTTLDCLVAPEGIPPAGWHRLGELFDLGGKFVEPKKPTLKLKDPEA